jgi:hypothetical protein
MMFLALPVFYVLGAAWLLRTEAERISQHSIFVASLFVGSMYLHYVFSRPDLPHLVMGIFPFIIGVLAMPVAKSKQRQARTGLVAGMLGMSVATVGYSDAMASPHVRKALGDPDFVPVNIRGDDIFVTPDLAQLITVVQRISSNLVGPGETMLIAPHWPGFYPILCRKSPTREIYFLFPLSVEQQQNTILKLKEQNTNWVILGDIALDGRDDLRFRNTHSLLWKHFQIEFEEVPVAGLPQNYQLVRRKVRDATQSVFSYATNDCRR